MKKKLLALLMALVLVTTVFFVIAKADAGDFGGDADFGGGWDGGGGGGWDNDDDDYGYYGGSSSSGGGGGGSIPTAIIVIIIIVIVIISNKRSKAGKAAPQRVDVGDRSTPQNLLTPMEQYKEIDPDFDPEALKDKMSNLYVQMQNNWTKKDFSPMRPYFADELYTQFERQLSQKTAQGLTNFVDRISVQNVELRGFRQEAGSDHIIVKLQTRIVDYTVKDATGEVVSGSNSKEKFMVYEWDITRTTGVKSGEIKKDGLGRSVCPSCGAPLDINASARCEYCGSVIRSSEHDWVISRITAISQTTVG